MQFIELKPYEGLYCFQELMDNDLSSVIYSRVKFTEFHIQSILYQILNGLFYLHSADVIHRDLKPGNILVNAHGNIKICDFGLARALGSPGVSPREVTSYVATRWYRAPEILVKYKFYGKAVDVWAVGCILGEMYGRCPLWQGKTAPEQFLLIASKLGPPPPSWLHDFECEFAIKRQYRKESWRLIYPTALNEALDLIEKLLQWHPAERLIVSEALEDIYFNKVRNSKMEVPCPRKFESGMEESVKSLDRLTRMLEMEVAKFQDERLASDP